MESLESLARRVEDLERQEAHPPEAAVIAWGVVGSSTSLPSKAWSEAVSFPSVGYDPAGAVRQDAPGWRWISPFSGCVLVAAQWMIAGHNNLLAGQYVNVDLRLNGAAVARPFVHYVARADWNLPVRLASVIRVQRGEALSLHVFQSSDFGLQTYSDYQNGLYQQIGIVRVG